MTRIQDILKHRILILDGAMGTMIQRYRLTENDFRGTRFIDSDILLKGNNDLLTITRPDIIENIHREYLDAGADIIETNTFNSQAISMADYHMKDMVREINLEAAKLAKHIAQKYSKENPNKPRFVAGSVGPTNKTASMGPQVENPMLRAVTFDKLVKAYDEQIQALIDGGIDLLLIETIFDTLNAKAALFAANHIIRQREINLPIMLSVTLSDKGGRTLSGQTLNAFVTSVSHINVLSIGLNCSFGANEMKPFLKELGRLSPTYISAYPNAGLPNQLGEYDETPDKMSIQIQEYIDERMVNIIGGCCGTTPKHIKAFAKLADGILPHIPSEKQKYLQLSGLETLRITSNTNFVNIGERCNVAGSRKFLRLIKENNYEEALSIARKQVEDGAQILDINMDDGLLDSVTEMINFLNLLSSDPDVSKVPFMIDSSKWEVLEAGLKCIQGKSIVNSISLKNGKSDFIHQARSIKQYGAAVIVMAFDEQGQADTFERRISICERAYKILIKEGFAPHDIIFDPNVLAIATGIEEHRNYAADFIKSAKWIKNNLPEAKISGGISNLSFSFRGNNYLREVMHSVFLYHAIKNGMDMGIVNSTESILYDDIPMDLRNLVEDVILNRRAEATDELIVVAEQLKDKTNETSSKKAEEWRLFSLDERLRYALIKGINEYLEDDLSEALKIYSKAVDIIDKPLMQGMNKVGELFGEGKMFLPQVVKTARTMKQAVHILQPVLERQKADNKNTLKAGKIIITTVKGDVHDIGKNIVGIILACNNYEVIDLGVMTPPETIIQKIKEEQPDIVCLSGLITPSLEEMCIVAQEMQKAGFSIPLMIGGATTSQLHTAIKIAPNYTNDVVVYTKDASQVPGVLTKLLNLENKKHFTESIKKEYQTLRITNETKKSNLLSYKESIQLKHKIDWSNYTPYKPNLIGRHVLKNIQISEIRPFIDWKFFFHTWKLSARFASCVTLDHCAACETSWINSFTNEHDRAKEALKLFKDANKMLDILSLTSQEHIKAIFAILRAYTSNDDDIIHIGQLQIPVLRQQVVNDKGSCLSLADFVMPQKFNKTDYLGAFTTSVQADELLKQYEKNNDSYRQFLLRTILDRLAEATTEWLHCEIRRKYWGYSSDEKMSVNDMFALKYKGIRPAVGYPSLPDQSINFIINNDLLQSSEIGVRLTENGIMMPPSSVSGLIFANPECHYFSIGKIDSEQLKKYTKQHPLNTKNISKFLSTNLL